jgi:hypothetical protein
LGTRKSFFIDLFLFAATVYVAWWNQWQVADLAWGLWISSLTLGYLFMLVSIVGTLIHGPANLFKSKPSEPDGKPPKHPIAGVIAPVIFILFLTGFSVVSLFILPYLLLIVFCRLSPILRQRPGWGFIPNIPPVIADVLIALPIMVFLLVFFTVHFGGFHMVHGMFLNQFFPLLKDVSLSSSIKGDISLFKTLILKALSQYWFFVLASGLSSWRNLVKAFKINDGSMMMRPYLNVIRMHVMIFVFAGMHALKIQGAALYIMLALYFFPVLSLIEIFMKKKKE